MHEHSFPKVNFPRLIPVDIKKYQKEDLARYNDNTLHDRSMSVQIIDWSLLEKSAISVSYSEQ